MALVITFHGTSVDKLDGIQREAFVTEQRPRGMNP